MRIVKQEFWGRVYTYDNKMYYVDTYSAFSQGFSTLKGALECLKYAEP